MEAVSKIYLKLRYYFIFKDTLSLKSSMFKIESHVFSWLKFHTPPRKDSNSPPLRRGRRSNAYGLPGGTDFEVSI